MTYHFIGIPDFVKDSSIGLASSLALKILFRDVLFRVDGRNVPRRPSNHTSNSSANPFHFSSNDFCDFLYSPSSSSRRNSDRPPAGIGTQPSPAAMKLQSSDESQTKALDTMSSPMLFSASGMPLCTLLLVLIACPGISRARSLGKGPETGPMPGNKKRPFSSMDRAAALRWSRSLVSRRVWHSFMTTAY